MNADEFRTALRVLDEGRPAHNIYEMEDAAAAIKPVQRAYWRMAVAVPLIALAPFSALFAFAHAPVFVATAASMIAPGLLLSAPALRDTFMPVRGLQWNEIVRAAMK